MGFWLNFLGIAIALIAVAVTYMKWSFQYWKRENIHYLEPKFPFGHLDNLPRHKLHIGVFLKIIYHKIRPTKAKLSGLFIFFKPILLVLDLDLIKNIMTKDFQYFTDRGIYYNEKLEPIGAHLFAIGGVKWRNLRSQLTPTFTLGKIKMMFQTLVDCGIKLEEMIVEKYDENNPVDIKEILECFTIDNIGSCAFGLECNSFKDENSPFRVYGKKAFQRDKITLLKFLMANSFPTIFKALNIKMLRTDVSDFFTSIVKDTVEYREKNNYSRNDFLQLLIDLKNNKLAEETGYQHDGKSLTMNEIVAQSYIFFLAGFETSSTTMTFALYELAKNPDVQDKVRSEIETVLGKHNNQITYDSINEMKYMDQVIDETLRKYPPFPALPRLCVQDYQIPDSSVVIKKNTTIFIPVYGIHHDENYYPDPEKFDPERFNEKNKESRHQYAHISFGEGPRICLGMRFALMQIKVGLTVLLRKYQFFVHSRTKEPLLMSSNSVVLAAVGGIWLTMQKLN